jgi:hypothetical protein
MLFASACLLLQVLVVGPRYGSWGTERYGVAPRQVNPRRCSRCLHSFPASLTSATSLIHACTADGILACQLLWHCFLHQLNR